MSFSLRPLLVLSLLTAGGTPLSAQLPRDRWVPLFVYDSTADRLLLFGGSFSGPDSRTYAFQHDRWSVVADSGPATRDDMAFGMVNGAPTFFGGRGQVRDASNQPMQRAYRETWRFDAGRWRLVDTTGPEGRSHPQGAYDPIRKRLVVFGGRSGVAQRGEPTRPNASDTWEWDGSRWHQLRAPEPPGRAGFVMAWDAAAKMVIIHGGISNSVLLTDTWGWNGTKWTQLSTAGPKTAFGAAATWPAGGIVMFGGHRMNDPDPTGTWHWNGKEWREVATTGPAARSFNAMTTDMRRGRVYLIAGKNDFWYLDRDFTWVLVSGE